MVAICGRVHLSPNHGFNLNKSAGDKHYFHRQGPNRSILMTASSTRLGTGGGVLDKPTIEKTTPSRDSEFDVRVLPRTTSVGTSRRRW
ncbi:ATP-dependent Clp protease adapter protein CLPS1, chloroplastic-like isoform X1 [Malus sylvestris]|uniref:ATP-dependent Clp protease adapter protein CLPS1, chloroplastic-like isoform X1 n=1 Tax=Malus sylvestris TaxID=3752 RepID=UPI0021AC2DA4|nr:ATP-dependent Clp protease adapter protein CLPS1, chloroplastic-like isoform X1 [Malus sylvestris]